MKPIQQILDSIAIGVIWALLGAVMWAASTSPAAMAGNSDSTCETAVQLLQQENQRLRAGIQQGGGKAWVQVDENAWRVRELTRRCTE